MVSIIIPVYIVNEKLFTITRVCLESLRSFTETPVELVVVDDASPRLGTRIRLMAMDHDAKVVAREENGGYATAVNTGLKEATGDTLVISNNDIIFTPGWLPALLKPLNEGYDIASIRTSDQTWETDDYISEGDKFGSLWAMKREVYEKLGGLDESFGKGYFEDLEFHKRAEKAGLKIGKNHGHLVEHLGKATFKTVDPDDKAYYEAKQLYFERFGKID